MCPAIGERCTAISLICLEITKLALLRNKMVYPIMINGRGLGVPNGVVECGDVLKPSPPEIARSLPLLYLASCPSLEERM